MKEIRTKRKNGTVSVAIDCSHPKLTDQSDKASADINNIMRVYQKTGVLPHVKEKIARYVDNTQVVSLEEAFNISKNAQEAFQSLPSDVRKLMDNDPTKLVDFLNDPKNEELLVKHDILEKVEVVQDVQPDPPAAAPVEPTA